MPADDRSAPDPEPPGHLVLVLNHNRDRLQDLHDALVRAGFRVMEAGSLAETQRMLQRVRPQAVVLNPLVLKDGGVELGLLESLQREEDPVPVLLLVEGLEGLDQARRLAVPFRDFLLKPCSPAECVHRVEIALRLRQRFLALQERARKLEGQVSIDFKTGLLSERYFRRLLGIEFKRSQRHQTPLSLLLLDVDDFKEVNDSTEYAFGDAVLRRVAESLKQNVRDIDYAARFGGDEFVVLLPHTSAAQAVQTALRIRQRISGLVIEEKDYRTQITVSLGIDSFDGRSTRLVDSLYRNANKALQEAKRRGKNQVWLYSDQDDAAKSSS